MFVNNKYIVESIFNIILNPFFKYIVYIYIQYILIYVIINK